MRPAVTRALIVIAAILTAWVALALLGAETEESHTELFAGRVGAAGPGGPKLVMPAKAGIR